MSPVSYRVKFVDLWLVIVSFQQEIENSHKSILMKRNHNNILHH